MQAGAMECAGAAQRGSKRTTIVAESLTTAGGRFKRGEQSHLVSVSQLRAEVSIRKPPRIAKVDTMPRTEEH
jgi:hypothetical protein